MSIFSKSSNFVKFRCRAKYIPDGNGGLRLAMVQASSRAIFSRDGWEDCADGEAYSLATGQKQEKRELSEAELLDNLARASRRAKVNAFDAILCNRDLDTFATFTFNPEAISDRTAYDQCYDALAPWLSNRVQRRGLKYIIAPERHEKGGIHFHMICNGDALRMERARSAKTGRALSHNGNPLYNVTDWSFGFTSAEVIRCADADRDAVAKYIFKYMGKQGGKIGGRYLLTGGKLARPVYLYGDMPEEFVSGEACTFEKAVECPGCTYREWSYI